MRKVIALLPMKGISERVPNKNIRDFCGEPLLFRMMNTLNSCELIAHIIVNTDSEKIRNIVMKFNKAIIHVRPHELRGNDISMNEIIRYDLATYQGDYSHFLQTHATNPLLSKKTIIAAIQTYFDNMESHDALFSVSKYQTRLYYPDGNGVNHDPDILINTQNLPILYEENSCIYIFSRSSFLVSGKKTGTNPFMFPIPKFEAFDIDTEDDFRLAEAAYHAQNFNNKGVL